MAVKFYSCPIVTLLRLWNLTEVDQKRSVWSEKMQSSFEFRMNLMIKTFGNVFSSQWATHFYSDEINTGTIAKIQRKDEKNLSTIRSERKVIFSRRLPPTCEAPLTKMSFLIALQSSVMVTLMLMKHFLFCPLWLPFQRIDQSKLNSAAKMLASTSIGLWMTVINKRSVVSSDVRTTSII